MAQKKEDEYLMKRNELQVEIRSLMKLNENEMASKEWHEERFIEEKNEYRRFRYTELQAFRDRELTVEAVKDELIDENMKLIESNNQLRTRVAELLVSRLGISAVTKPVPRQSRNCMKNFAKETWRLADFKKELRLQP